MNLIFCSCQIREIQAVEPTGQVHQVFPTPSQVRIPDPLHSLRRGIGRLRQVRPEGGGGSHDCPQRRRTGPVGRGAPAAVESVARTKAAHFFALFKAARGQSHASSTSGRGRRPRRRPRAGSDLVPSQTRSCSQAQGLDGEIRPRRRLLRPRR